MTSDMRTVLGIIAARGGSRRIPRKNIRPIAGAPLIYYTFEAAKHSTLLTQVILSSDDPEIIDYARRQNVDVPFVRPAHLATDQASSAEVVLHAVEYMEHARGMQFEYVCLLEPTSPLRRADDIDGALRLLFAPGCDSVLSLMPADCGSYARIRHVRDGGVAPAFPKAFARYMVDKAAFPRAYIPGGGIFCCTTALLRHEKQITAGTVKPYIMQRHRGIDINDADDVVMAEALLRVAGSPTGSEKTSV